MLVVLHTNHFTEPAFGSELGRRLSERIEERGADPFSCIVAAEKSLQDGLLSFEDTGQEQSKSKATLGFTLACKRLQSSPCFPPMSRQPTFSTTSKHNIAVPARWI